MQAKPAEVRVDRGAVTYRVSNSGEWATITMFSWTGDARHGGEILIHSSFGSWGYSWGNIGQSFAAFLLDVEFSYLFDKFEPGTLRVFDGPLSFEQVKRALIEARREQQFSKDTARRIWDELGAEQHRLEGSEREFVEACNDARDTVLDDAPEADKENVGYFFQEPWERIRRSANEQAKGFWRELWPPFKAKLEAELKEVQHAAVAD